MQAIKAYTQIYGDIDGQEILNKIERCGRVCYKSEGKIEEGSAAKFVANIIKRGHEAVLEHASITVKFVVDRGVSHEIVRHRIASYCQESQRYCNYAKDDFGKEITFIIPEYLDYKSEGWNTWKEAMKEAEKAYFKMIDLGFTPQEARAVLPNSTKTEVVMTANLREWRAFFKLRTSKAAHPQMREVTIPLLEELKQMIPVIFDDIEVVQDAEKQS
jgi:thymidylate synthase (FAD)